MMGNERRQSLRGSRRRASIRRASTRRGIRRAIIWHTIESISPSTPIPIPAAGRPVTRSIWACPSSRWRATVITDGSGQVCCETRDLKICVRRRGHRMKRQRFGLRAIRSGWRRFIEPFAIRWNRRRCWTRNGIWRRWKRNIKGSTPCLGRGDAFVRREESFSQYVFRFSVGSAIIYRIDYPLGGKS